MGIYRLFFLVAVGACLLAKARAWGSDEMELFDLVEEVNKINKNFYEVLEISQVKSKFVYFLVSALNI